MKILCSIMLVITLFSIGNAQGSSRNRITSSKKPIIKREYNRFKDSTTVSTIITQLSNPREDFGENLRLDILSTFDGQKVLKPPFVVGLGLTLISSSESKLDSFYSETSLVFLIDGERIKPIVAKKSARTDYVAGMLFAFNPEIIKKIAYSKRAEMRVGDDEILITESQKEIFKEFYKTIVP